MSFTETSPPGSSQHDPKPGVVSADSQPWISYSEPKTADAEPASKAPAKTSVLPFAIGGALGVAALAAGAFLVVRHRARPKTVGERVAHVLASPVVKSVATSLGGAVLAGGTTLLKDTLSRYVSARAELAASTD